MRGLCGQNRPPRGGPQRGAFLRPCRRCEYTPQARSEPGKGRLWVGFDFDTSGRGGRGGGRRDLFGDNNRRSESTGEADGSMAAWWLWLWGGSPNSGPGQSERSARGDYVIPGGSRKAVLVHLAVAVWRSGGYVPRDVLPQVRGHDLDPEAAGAEDKLVRALTRSSMGAVEQVLGPNVRGKLVVFRSRLQGSSRTSI